jgi:hypothetical protein
VSKTYQNERRRAQQAAQDVAVPPHRERRDGADRRLHEGRRDAVVELGDRGGACSWRALRTDPWPQGRRRRTVSRFVVTPR